MKNTLFLIAFISSLFFISCENEPIGTAEINYDIVDNELLGYLQLINNNNPSEETINCIEFNYSFTLFVFDATMEFSEAVAVFNNEDFISLLDTLLPEESISINFPISGTLSNGDLVEINSNEALKQAIEACSKDERRRRCNNTLSECVWQVFPANGTANEYIGSSFKVNRNGTVQFHHEAATYFGTWVTLYIGDDLFLNIDLNDDDTIESFWDVNWEIIGLSNNQIQITNNTTEVQLVKNCDIPCTEEGFQVCEEATTPGIGIFNFENYTTCIPIPATHDVVSAVSYSFFETEEDALNNTNAVAPTAYSNSSNPQTIYTRITYVENGELVGISSFIIEAISCNEG